MLSEPEAMLPLLLAGHPEQQHASQAMDCTLGGAD